jgi:short-subunit dehydrogenase
VRLVDSVVLLTGSSSGIGAACAAALADRGARVIIHGRDADRLDVVAAGVGAKAIRADLAAAGAAEQLADAAVDVFGHVDAVVHCAGVGWYGRAAEMPGTTIDELLDVNVRTPLRLTRALLPAMVERRSGHVGFLASIAGWTGVADEAVYAATKAAVITYAESLRTELAGSGVGVSVVSPAVVRTDFFERRGAPYARRFPRPVRPERIATAVVRGIEHERAHQMIPRWLVLAPAARAVAPGAFRTLSRRFG